MTITKGADYNPDKGCLPGTREDVLGEIRSWINGEGEHANTQAFLLLGPAGIGKSAILHRIAKECTSAQRLAASFCFAQDRGVDNFFRTIARSIAALDPGFASAVAAVLMQDPTLQHTTVLSSQIKYLLQEPFESLSVLGTIIIVIDALDECHAEGRDELVQCLHQHVPSFPKNIRFLITSRPSEARDLSEIPWVHTCFLDTATAVDLHTFVEHQLTDYKTGKLLPHFSKHEIQTIVSAAEGLFQHAYVVCKEIKKADKDLWENPLAVFTELVTKGSHGLDSLYFRILSNAYNIPFSSTPSQEVPFKLLYFRKVLGWILHAHARLSRKILLEFDSPEINNGTSDTGTNSEPSQAYGPVAAILQPLAALLSGTEDSGGDIYPLHSSFYDFLTNKQRSKDFYVGSNMDHHAQIANICLKIMKFNLHFNMANLQSSYMLNCDVVDLKDRMDIGISQGLSYACKHWAWHLEASKATHDNFMGTHMVSSLLQSSYIFYLEVLSLEERTEHAIEAYRFLMNWVAVSLYSVSHKIYYNFTFQTALMKTYLHQWSSLLHNFRLVAEKCTPHLYVSGLSWTSVQSLENRQCFQHLLTGPRKESLDHLQAQDPDFQGAIFGHSNRVWFAAFSPDCTKIVSASEDNTVCIWDVQSGAQIGQPFTGHTDLVRSAAFSPDGTKIVSASHDTTVRIWDVQSGAQIRQPFTGHTSMATSAAFSHNGTRIVSASADRTVRIWDVQSGAQIGQPFIGHTNMVTTAAFSLDETKIVTSSHDKTVRIWNVQSHAQIGQPFIGHTDKVTSAAFSRDGTKVLSSSDDKTVRIWDVQSGSQHGQPFTGHGHWVRFAAFSPDETKIVSASQDQTVRIWNTHSHAQIGQSFAGHTHGVTTAMFSCDSTKIVSASCRKTTRTALFTSFLFFLFFISLPHTKAQART